MGIAVVRFVTGTRENMEAMDGESMVLGLVMGMVRNGNSHGSVCARKVRRGWG